MPLYAGFFVLYIGVINCFRNNIWDIRLEIGNRIGKFKWTISWGLLRSTIMRRELSAFTIKVLTHRNTKGMCLCLRTVFSICCFLKVWLLQDVKKTHCVHCHAQSNDTSPVMTTHKWLCLLLVFSERQSQSGKDAWSITNSTTSFELATKTLPQNLCNACPPLLLAGSLRVCLLVGMERGEVTEIRLQGLDQIYYDLHVHVWYTFITVKGLRLLL